MKKYIIILFLVGANLNAQDKALPDDFIVTFDVTNWVTDLVAMQLTLAPSDYVTFLDKWVASDRLSKSGVIYSGVWPLKEHYAKDRSLFRNFNMDMAGSYRVSESFIFRKVNSDQNEPVEPEFVEVAQITINSQTGNITIGGLTKMNPPNAFLRAWYGQNNKPTQATMRTRLRNAKAK